MEVCNGGQDAEEVVGSGMGSEPVAGCAGIGRFRHGHLWGW